MSLRNYQLTLDERRRIEWGYVDVLLDCGHVVNVKNIYKALRCVKCAPMSTPVGVLAASGDLVPLTVVRPIRKAAWERREALRAKVIRDDDGEAA
jgi:hypothetical protein